MLQLHRKPLPALVLRLDARAMIKMVRSCNPVYHTGSWNTFICPKSQTVMWPVLLVWAYWLCNRVFVPYYQHRNIHPSTIFPSSFSQQNVPNTHHKKVHGSKANRTGTEGPRPHHQFLTCGVKWVEFRPLLVPKPLAFLKIERITDKSLNHLHSTKEIRICCSKTDVVWDSRVRLCVACVASALKIQRFRWGETQSGNMLLLRYATQGEQFLFT